MGLRQGRKEELSCSSWQVVLSKIIRELNLLYQSRGGIGVPGLGRSAPKYNPTWNVAQLDRVVAAIRENERGGGPLAQ
jgi:hypothetical protein